MRKSFVPSYYYQELHQKLQRLTQEIMFVEDYHKEMEIAMMCTNVTEDKKATMAQFMSGVNKEIANIIELHHYIDGGHG